MWLRPYLSGWCKANGYVLASCRVWQYCRPERAWPRVDGRVLGIEVRGEMAGAALYYFVIAYGLMPTSRGCRPSGTRARAAPYPGLTPWANVCRRFAAWASMSRKQSHPFTHQNASIHANNPGHVTDRIHVTQPIAGVTIYFSNSTVLIGTSQCASRMANRRCSSCW